MQVSRPPHRAPPLPKRRGWSQARPSRLHDHAECARPGGLERPNFDRPRASLADRPRCSSQPALACGCRLVDRVAAASRASTRRLSGSSRRPSHGLSSPSSLSKTRRPRAARASWRLPGTPGPGGGPGLSLVPPSPRSLCPARACRSWGRLRTSGSFCPSPQTERCRPARRTHGLDVGRFRRMVCLVQAKTRGWSRPPRRFQGPPSTRSRRRSTRCGSSSPIPERCCRGLAREGLQTACGALARAECVPCWRRP